MTEEGQADEAPAKGTLTTSDAADLPHLYTNGFQVSVTNADISLILKLDQRPTHVINLSYTLAKTLSVKMAGVVSQFEEAVGRDMLTTEQVDEAFRAMVEKRRERLEKDG